MSQLLSTRLILMLVHGIRILKAVRCQHPVDAGHYSLRDMEKSPVKENADEALSASVQGTPESCWSPCNRFHETPSTRHHPLPLYDSVVPGVRRVGSLMAEGIIPEYDSRHKQVVLLQTHYRQVFAPELVAHIESLIAESAPRRVYILFSCHDVIHDLMVLPSSLRPYAYPYTHSDIEATYFYRANAGKWNLKVDTDLPAMLFALSHPWYDFAWVMEDDVRLIGNWDSFFADAFNEAARVEELKQQEKEKASPDVVHNTEYRNTTSSLVVTDPRSNIHAGALSPPADLVVFWEPVHSQPAWGWYDHASNIPDHLKRHTLLTIRGLSRRLLREMHAHFSQNVTAYFEMFAPSVAHMTGFSTAFVPQYDRDGSLSCCSPEAINLYNSWLSNGTVCQKPMLLHPIKSPDVLQEFFATRPNENNCPT